MEALDGQLAANSLPGKAIALKGASNCRDLGGIRTVSGKAIRSGVLFRSGELANLTTTDAELLRTLGIRRVVDLRGEQEAMRRPDRVLEGVETIRCPIVPGSEDIAEMTRLLVNETEAYRRMLMAFMQGTGVPTLIHCAAGKDRTGFAIALILLTLGVPKESVIADYMRTNLYLNEVSPANGSIEGGHPGELGEGDGAGMQTVGLLSALEVRAEYLEAALREIDAKFGSLDGYLIQGLSLPEDSRKQLEAVLLE
ncbi:MAG: protein tyrosine/serine phosphatase [Paenibacillus sp.]|jgi:protein-tyrosine phosphatase|nr:protein tyrosine/serine phosphatase [Paenibacillus sp.]